MVIDPLVLILRLLLRRLFLVGFCVLILPGTVLQLMIAFVFSLFCMLLTAVASPFISDVDDSIGKAFGFALSAIFFFAVVIKVSTSTTLHTFPSPGARPSLTYHHLDR